MGYTAAMDIGHIDLKALGERLKDVFLNQDKYQMDLVIKEFDGADFLFFYIYEAHDDAPPTFYFITSPWDQKSGAAPQGAQVFDNGKLVLQMDYTEYVKVRTGLMDAFALDALKKSPAGKRILYIGSGGVAAWSLRALKAYFPDVESVDYKGASGKKESFEKLASDIGVLAKYAAEPDISAYDFIFMHTNSREPVLLEADVAKLKEGAFVSLYSDKKEAALEVYKDAAVLVNWPDSFTKETDLIEGKDTGVIDPEQAVTMLQVLEGKTMEEKHHTVFRSGGTPMQNIATLKYLMANTK